MALSFLFIAVALGLIGSAFMLNVQNAWIPFFSLDMSDDVNVWSIGEMITENFKDVLVLLLIIIIGAMGLGVLVGALQTKFLISFKAIKFDLNRINPVQGFKRLFSLRSIFELLKALLKVAIVVIVGYYAIKGKWQDFLLYPFMPIQDSAGHLALLIHDVMIRTGIALLALAVLDFYYQRWEYEKSLRMTKQEVKDEMKDIEGNPEVKRKQRQMMYEILRSRMMAEVPKATVVITNPTHIAVALRYDREEDEAPVVVAKGKDFLAEKIKEIARKFSVPIVRNPPLARMLYENVDVGEYIPPDLYRAVAEVLVYIYSTREVS